MKTLQQCLENNGLSFTTIDEENKKIYIIDAKKGLSNIPLKINEYDNFVSINSYIISKVNDEKLPVVYELINDINSKIAYGRVFLKKSAIRYSVGFSTEGTDKKVFEEQLLDYINNAEGIILSTFMQIRSIEKKDERIE